MCSRVVCGLIQPLPPPKRPRRGQRSAFETDHGCLSVENRGSNEPQSKKWLRYALPMQHDIGRSLADTQAQSIVVGS